MNDYKDKSDAEIAAALKRIAKQREAAKLEETELVAERRRRVHETIRNLSDENLAGFQNTSRDPHIDRFVKEEQDTRRRSLEAAAKAKVRARFAAMSDAELLAFNPTGSTAAEIAAVTAEMRARAQRFYVAIRELTKAKPVVVGGQVSKTAIANAIAKAPEKRSPAERAAVRRLSE